MFNHFIKDVCELIYSGYSTSIKKLQTCSDAISGIEVYMKFSGLISMLSAEFANLGPV